MFGGSRGDEGPFVRVTLPCGWGARSRAGLLHLLVLLPLWAAPLNLLITSSSFHIGVPWKVPLFHCTSKLTDNSTITAMFGAVRFFTLYFHIIGNIWIKISQNLWSQPKPFGQGELYHQPKTDSVKEFTYKDHHQWLAIISWSSSLHYCCIWITSTKSLSFSAAHLKD